MINKSIILRDGMEPKPTLTTYVLDDSMENGALRPAVLVCPGGGYAFCSPREAEPIAIQYNAAGFHAFVLNYSVFPNRYPMALEEASKAVSIIRENAAEWRVDPDKIAVIGFSAGGHLAGALGVFWNTEPIECGGKNKPNAVILAYPVITSGVFAHRGSFENLCGENSELIEKMSLEKQVSEDTPPMFLWHTFEDQSVPVENSLMMAAALRKKNIPFELHIYPKGQHGLSTVRKDVGILEKDVSKGSGDWVKQSVNWLEDLFEL